MSICLTIFPSLSTVAADVEVGESAASVVNESGEHTVSGGKERVIEALPPPKVDWGPADQALRTAMAGDPTFSTDALRREAKAADPSFPIATPADVTQTGAIAGWQRFLERSDLTEEQQVFAWWRIGSLYVYNFDPSRGEIGDVEKGKEAMQRVRQIVAGLVSDETLNSATVFGTCPGAADDRAQRLAEAFNWIATLGDEEIDKSATRVNGAGYVIDGRHLPGGGKPDQTLEERKQFLRKLLADYRQTITKRISEEIEYSDDPKAIAILMESVEDTADPQIKEQWQEMSRKLSANVLRPESPKGSRRLLWNVILVVVVLSGYLVIRRRMRRRKG